MKKGMKLTSVIRPRLQGFGALLCGFPLEVSLELLVGLLRPLVLVVEGERAQGIVAGVVERRVVLLARRKVVRGRLLAGRQRGARRRRDPRRVPVAPTPEEIEAKSIENEIWGRKEDH